MRAAWRIAACLFAALPAAISARQLPLEKIKLPPGFRIEIYSARVPDARSLAVSPSGTVFVGNRKGGNVYALPDRNHDGKPDEVLVIARRLNSPNGVAFREGALYVAEINRIWRYDAIEAHLKSPLRPVLVSNNFPSDAWHGWRFIAFGPDGWLYVPVGAPCNVCEPKDWRSAAILRMRQDGSGLELFARGVRNTVGFDWEPGTHELWFTDNGRDYLGDDQPPDELNHAPRPGMNFGFPYCHGAAISDPELGKKHPCSEFTPPAQALPAHVAALGMRFYTGSLFPQEYRNQIFIAEHGSWNRSRKIGYRISCVKLQSGKPISYEVFAEGWLEKERAWGRPVDLLVMPDGSLLVSDDEAGAIYRITYSKPLSAGGPGG